MLATDDSRSSDHLQSLCMGLKLVRAWVMDEYTTTVNVVVPGNITNRISRLIESHGILLKAVCVCAAIKAILLVSNHPRHPSNGIPREEIFQEGRMFLEQPFKRISTSVCCC